MKKALVLPALIFLSVALVQSATLNITKPIPGKVFQTGSKITITWDVLGSMSGTLKILLRKASDAAYKVLIKENHPPAANLVQYTIPPSITQGTYFIRINYDGGFARSGDFTIKPGFVLAGSQLGPVHKKPPIVGVQPATSVNTQLLTSLSILSFKVNGVATSTIHNRINCTLSQGISCQVTVAGPVPREYKYTVTLLNPEDGFRYDVYSSAWISMNNYTIQIPYNTVLDKLFPGGIQGSTIPVAVMGEVTVQVKTPTQTDLPKQKEHAIYLYL